VPVMNTVGIERRWSRPSGSPPRIGLRRPVALAVALVSVGAVFACFFAIGHATDSRSARAEGPAASLPVASVGAAIPVGLTSAPPIEIYVAPPPPRPSPHPSSPPSAPPTSPAPVQPVAHQAPSAPVASPQPAPSAPAPRAPERSAPVSQPSAPVSAPRSSGGSPGSGSGKSQPSAHGGGSFESSG
jgi:hypothetical protein